MVDNGTEGDSAIVVEQAGQLAGVHLIRNGKNIGIAAALNVGVRHALRAGCQWVATFDQDSTVTPRYFEGLLGACVACRASGEVGMIVPGCWFSRAVHVPKPGSPSDPDCSFVRVAANSGNLVRADVFSTVGFYDEAMFIDYVDVDFCLRLQKKGFKILAARRVALRHELGSAQTRTLLGYRISFRVHVDWRYYYIMRNRLVLYRRYWSAFPLWALRDAFHMILELSRMVCLEDGKASKLRCAFLGLRNGIQGKQGRHPAFPNPLTPGGRSGGT
jgi:rhamnosyltransferase